MALVMETVITTNYWIVIHNPDKGVNYYNFVDHAVPMISLVIDWHLNRIMIEYRQAVFHLLNSVGYAIFLISYTLGTGKPIYKVANLESLASWIFVMSNVVISLIIALTAAAYSSFKFLVYDITLTTKVSARKSQGTEIMDEIILVLL